MTATGTLDTALAAAINGWLGLDPAARARLAALDGRIVALHLRIIELTVTLRVEKDRIAVVHEPELQPDTVLHGTPLGMARLGLGSDTPGTLFSGDVEITGDVETGQAFRAILDGMDIDWEEQLSGVTGDIMAFRIMQGIRNTRQWVRDSFDSLSLSGREYLQEESRQLPTKVEFERFKQNVTDTMHDVERLQARLNQLLNNKQ